MMMSKCAPDAEAGRVVWRVAQPSANNSTVAANGLIDRDRLLVRVMHDGNRQ